MIRVFTLALVGLSLSITASALPSRYVSGVHYTTLDQPAPTADDGKIEVIEFFLYSCPHCYAFDPELRAWVEQLGQGVAFRRVPVTFGAAGPVYARMFYTAKALGVLHQLHSDIFKAIHEQGKPLLKPGAIRAFFVAHGVEGKAFDDTFGSDAVTNKVEAARALMRTYRVTSVPSLGVNGRYWVNAVQAGSHEAMLEIADFLIQRERLTEDSQAAANLATDASH